VIPSHKEVIRHAKAYSLDLRRRVVRFVEMGRSRHAAASHFDVSVSFVVNLMKSWQATGKLEPQPGGGRRHAKLEAHRAFLLARITEKGDITMPELAAELASATGEKAAPASLSRWLIRNGYRFKKNTAGKRTRPAGRQKGAPGVDDQAPTKDAA
jgi:transposase